MISRYISTALCAAASVPFRSGGVAASLQGEGLGERIGMEWVLDKSVFDFSFFGKSVLCISLFNCVGFSNVGFSNVGFSCVGLSNVGFSNVGKSGVFKFLNGFADSVYLLPVDKG